jgi:hypothetical protein
VIISVWTRKDIFGMVIALKYGISFFVCEETISYTEPV